LSVLETQPASSQDIQNMKLVIGQSGWLQVSSRLFWTDTQGMQWTDITPIAETNDSISGVYFNTSGDGWSFLVSSDQKRVVVARTSDKGAHWNYSTLPSPFGEATPYGGQAYSYFSDSQNGWVVFRLRTSAAFRRGLLFHTTDGGVHWTQCPDPPVGGELVFSDAQNGWMGPGPQGDELYRTADGGQSWQKAELATPTNDLSGVRSTIELPHFSDSLQGTLLRSFRTDKGTTVVSYRVADGGVNWKPQSIVLKNEKQTIAVLTAEGEVTGKIQAQAAGSTASILKSSLATEVLPVRASFTNENLGWVLFAGGNCDHTEGVCTQSRILMGTRDGGASFFSLGTISGVKLELTKTFALPVGNGQANEVLGNTLRPESANTEANVMGFDICDPMTTSQLQTWATSSPYKVVGVYFGGSEFSCQSTLSNVTTSWTSTVLGQGWEIIPIWVGPQAPGGKFTYLMSTNPATAYQGGVAEADLAIAALNARGISQGSPIIYDIEAYTYSNATYVAATQSFLQGWTTELHAKGYISGVYSSHPEFKSWYSTLVNPAPDDIWFAYFFSDNVACGTQCQTVFPTNSSFDISSTYWTNHHRMRQTSDEINVTYGGVTGAAIDEDWIDAAMVTATPNTLTVAKAGAGSGTVTSTQIGSTSYTDVSSYTQISCGSACTAKFAATDIVTLQAAAGTASAFGSWSGCDSVSSNTCTVTVSSTKTVTATFTSTATVPVAAAPTFSPVAGTFSTAQTVVISSTTSGASIYYTTDGSTPTTSSKLYSGPINVSSTQTLSAIAVASGYTNSSVASAVYTITAATLIPTASTTSLTIVQGQSGTASVAIAPSGTYTGTVSFSCSGLPSYASCSFSPATLTFSASSATQSTMVMISTVATSAQLEQHRSGRSIIWAFLFPLFLTPYALSRKKMRLCSRFLVVLMICGIGLASVAGCGGGNSSSNSGGSTTVFNNTVYVNIASSTSTMQQQVPIVLKITK
jgi:hypothetical protein